MSVKLIYAGLNSEGDGAAWFLNDVALQVRAVSSPSGKWIGIGTYNLAQLLNDLIEENNQLRQEVEHIKNCLAAHSLMDQAKK